MLDIMHKANLMKWHADAKLLYIKFLYKTFLCVYTGTDIFICLDKVSAHTGQKLHIQFRLTPLAYKSLVRFSENAWK